MTQFSSDFLRQLRLPSLLNLAYKALLTTTAAVGLAFCFGVTPHTCVAQATAPSRQDQERSAQPTEAFHLRVESNLVIVRALVRDSEGRPIENLKREDFKLFDKGKEEVITQFEAVGPALLPLASPSNPTNPTSPRPEQLSPSPEYPRYLALYFDDLNTSEADMTQARDAAAQYIAANLQTKDHVAIFTSEAMLSSFTTDPKQIREALTKVQVSAKARSRIRECPDLTDYQAFQVSEIDNIGIDAWKVAIDEAVRCGMADPAIRRCLVAGACDSGDPQFDAIRSVARSIVAQAKTQTRSSLEQLERVVRDLSRLSGQRTIVLVSPGFLTVDEQIGIDNIIDRALRAEVVVSSIDPKGLALLMREADVTRGYTPAANSGVITSTHDVDFVREARTTDVLAELAEGTGGEFFHRNNDLKAGFRALAGESTYYVLAFVPKKLDGKFHKLQIKLARSKGAVKARRGYFAMRNGPNP